MRRCSAAVFAVFCSSSSFVFAMDDELAKELFATPPRLEDLCARAIAARVLPMQFLPPSIGGRGESFGDWLAQQLKHLAPAEKTKAAAKLTSAFVAVHRAECPAVLMQMREPREFLRDATAVVACDGARYVIGDSKGKLAWKSPDRPGEWRVWCAHNEKIEAVGIHGPSERVISASVDKSVRVWRMWPGDWPGTPEQREYDLLLFEQYRTLCEGAGPSAVALGFYERKYGEQKTARHVAVVGFTNGLISTWQLCGDNSGHLLNLIGGERPVYTLGCAQNMAAIVSGDAEGRLRVWDFSVPRVQNVFDGDGAWSTKVVLKVPELADVSGRQPHILRSRIRLLREKRLQAPIFAAAFQRDGCLIAYGAGNHAGIWEWHDNSDLCTFGQAHNANVRALWFNGGALQNAGELQVVTGAGKMYDYHVPVNYLQGTLALNDFLFTVLVARFLGSSKTDSAAKSYALKLGKTPQFKQLEYAVQSSLAALLTQKIRKCAARECQEIQKALEINNGQQLGELGLTDDQITEVREACGPLSQLREGELRCLGAIYCGRTPKNGTVPLPHLLEVIDRTRAFVDGQRTGAFQNEYRQSFEVSVRAKCAQYELRFLEQWLPEIVSQKRALDASVSPELPQAPMPSFSEEQRSYLLEVARTTISISGYCDDGCQVTPGVGTVSAVAQKQTLDRLADDARLGSLDFEMQQAIQKHISDHQTQLKNMQSAMQAQTSEKQGMLSAACSLVGAGFSYLLKPLK